jgi:hypothetical protein
MTAIEDDGDRGWRRPGMTAAENDGVCTVIPAKAGIQP